MSGVCQTCGGTSWVGSPDNHRYPPHLRSDVECPDCTDPALGEEPEEQDDPQPMMTCPLCKGDGNTRSTVPGRHWMICPRCKGEGEVENPDYEPILCGLCGVQEPRPGHTACRRCAG